MCGAPHYAGIAGGATTAKRIFVLSITGGFFHTNLRRTQIRVRVCAERVEYEVLVTIVHPHELQVTIGGEMVVDH